MKKFLTALLALILALAMAFTMVACTDDNGGQDNNGGDNNGGNEQEETLEPVDAKVFTETILDQISKAEGLSVTLNASAQGSTTVTDAAGVATPTTIDESVSDTYALDEAKTYISNTLTVFDDIWGLFAGIDGIDSIFAGTVQPVSDNSGYEYTVSITTEQVQSVLSTIQGFFRVGEDGQSQAKKTTFGSILTAILPKTVPDGFVFNEESSDSEATQIAKEWANRLFSETLTLRGFYDILMQALEEGGVKEEANAILRIVTGIVIDSPISFDELGAMLDLPAVEDGGASNEGVADTNEEGKTMGDMLVSEIVDPLLSSALGMSITFSGIGSFLISNWDYSIADFYSLIVMMGSYVGLPTLPTIDDIINAKLEKAELTVTLTTDKEMKITGFAASASFKGSCNITTNFGATVTNYAADITASASGTFGYETIAA